MLSVVCGMVRSGLAPPRTECFFSVINAGLNARFSRCRGAAEDLPHLPAPRRGQKSNGRGVQPRIPLSFVYRVPPSPLHIYVRCGSRQGGSRGEAVSGPAPGPAGNAKSGAERKYSTPPEKSERNTIGPIPRLSPLQKGVCLGIIRLRCSRKTVVLSGRDTHHRGIAGSQPAMPCRFIAFPSTFYRRL